MKIAHRTVASATLFLAFTGAAMAADVGVSVSIGEPGFYGQINLGSAPPPALVNPNPVVIAPAATPMDPIYLRVPPEHRRNWKRFCAKYDACGRPVYFVQDRWYNNVYVPHYRAHREEFAPRAERREEHREPERHEERRDDRRDRRD